MYWRVSFDMLLLKMTNPSLLQFSFSFCLLFIGETATIHAFNQCRSSRRVRVLLHVIRGVWLAAVTSDHLTGCYSRMSDILLDSWSTWCTAKSEAHEMMMMLTFRMNGRDKAVCWAMNSFLIGFMQTVNPVLVLVHCKIQRRAERMPNIWACIFFPAGMAWRMKGGWGWGVSLVPHALDGKDHLWKSKHLQGDLNTFPRCHHTCKHSHIGRRTQHNILSRWRFCVSTHKYPHILTDFLIKGIIVSI